ncbi:universal stress protein UspA-like protein [Rivularia sp. PCC 7116]|uniref:universal stress protein n=1 Tax=Rivularia sp. PCC 7116 TaxID=373994 RepID=UPI00029ECCFE|nr:universal stress protein [Rivularia sp. PCC 7116]AFY55250.1 universal stress protein UspA-like protein [Rivularia sp. PCC 7116]
MTFQKILVALELSPRDESVFSEALNLAKNVGAQLSLIHCLSDLTEMAMMSQTGLDTGYAIPVTPSASTMSPAMVNIDLIKEANITKHQQVEKHLALYQKQASSLGVSVECKCYESTGNTGSQICRIAQDLNVDLIILGRKGHNAIAEALLGSVSNYVLHHAPCAILVIQ